MKLTCDLCGGTLLMKRGGQEAACTQCGISYSIDRLREKLAMNNVATNTTPPQLFMPKQFIMEVSRGSGDISGRVKQGGIGLGDRIYINND